MIAVIDILFFGLLVYGMSRLLRDSNNSTLYITYTTNELEESNNSVEENNEVPPKYEEIQPPNYDNLSDNN